MLRRSLVSLICTLMMMLYVLSVTALGVAEVSASKAETAKDKASVSIKKELKLLEQVSKRRMLLQYLKHNKTPREEALKGLASGSASEIKGLLEKEKDFDAET